MAQDSTETIYDNGSSGAAKTIDWNNGRVQKVTLSANCTFTFSNPLQGFYILILIQDGTGTRTATWPGTVKWTAGTGPVLTVTASKTDIVTFTWDGTSYLAGPQTFNL